MDLASDLKTSKSTLDEFFKTASRVLAYMPNVISSSKEKDHFVIYESTNSGRTQYLRPINRNLFISDQKLFNKAKDNVIDSFEKIRKYKSKNGLNQEALDNLDSVIYTTQQSLGCGMDLLINSNSARKHIGNRLEELMKCIFSEIGITNKKVVLKIPYEHEGKIKSYKCENDLILSPYESVRSSAKDIDINEVVVSVKTSSKDRMGKIFIDKMLLKKFVGHDVKMVGIFLNDVQRKKTDNISYTLVSGLFMVYTNFLTEMEGIYYLDPPPKVNIAPYKSHIHRFSDFLSKDVWKLLTP